MGGIALNRKEVLDLEEEKLLRLIAENYETKISDLDDDNSLNEAWLIVQKLLEAGWRIDIQAYEDFKKVDGIYFNKGRPMTIFARYGSTPKFDSVVEGILRLALIIKKEKIT